MEDYMTFTQARLVIVCPDAYDTTTQLEAAKVVLASLDASAEDVLEASAIITELQPFDRSTR
jgi:hypothetical protein